MREPVRSLYDVLGVSRTSGFDVLKKAYYRRAKECHPDLHPGCPAKAEEFRQVVAAFDILSDPHSRRDYDEQLARQALPPEPALFRQDGPSVLDTFADDILEEMVVGNTIPRGTTLQTLMLDLTRTRRFVTFREAKNRYYAGEFRKAWQLCARLLRRSPENILYHYYLAEAARRLGRLGTAQRHYRHCLRIGQRRVPPQNLSHIRRRLEQTQVQRGAVGRVMSWFNARGLETHIAWREEMTGQLRRYFADALRRQERRQPQRALGPRRAAGPNRLLPPGPSR